MKPVTVFKLAAPGGAALLFAWAPPFARGAALTWDANTGTSGAQDGGGTWNASGNNNWWNGAANTTWLNANLDSATFGAGTDGTYAVTLSGTVQAGGGVTFANSGYTLSGTALLLHDGTNNSAITVNANTSATINSAITYLNNKPAAITVNSGAILNLGGGANNSQYNFTGGGSVNMTAGTYAANVGRADVASFNQSGGTFNMTPGNGTGYVIGYNAGKSVNYTLSGTGTVNVNGNASTATVLGSFLSLGRASANTSFISALTVQGGATVNIGTTASRAGELRISHDATSSGKFDVQGGTVTVGTGDPANNQIYFFKGGANAGYTAAMTQSGGTVTANGIQFGYSSGTYDAASAATLQLSGGSLYVGALGITRGSAAGTLPVTIRLQGGTLGADQNWTSALDMALGTTGGGVTIRAANAANASKNITLSGSLSNDGVVNGTLAKTGGGTLTLSGVNTYSGATTVSAGTLQIGGAGQLGSGSYAADIANDGTFQYSSTADQSLSGVISGTGALTKDASSTGTLTLSGANSYNGTTTVSGGTLRLGTSNVIPDGSGKGSVVVSGTGMLDLNGFSETINGLSNNGTVDNTAVSSASTLTVTGSGTFSGKLQNSGTGATLALVKSGNTDFILSGTNTYSGATTINQGRLFISGANGVALSPNTTVQIDSGTLVLNTSGSPTFNQSITLASGGRLAMRQAATVTNVTLPTSGSVVFNSDDVATVAFNVGADIALTGDLAIQVGGSNPTVGAVTLAGEISGGSGLTKTSTGTLVLSGTNTYSGPTNVNAGTLLVTGALGNTAVTVGSDAVIGGDGSLGGSLTLTDGALLDLTGASLGLVSTGVLTVTGTIQLDNFAFADLIGWDWQNATVGTYTLINGGSGVTFAGTTPTISNPFDFGNGRSGYFQEGSLQAVVVPEPGAGLLGSLGLLALLRRRRLV